MTHTNVSVLQRDKAKLAAEKVPVPICERRACVSCGRVGVSYMRGEAECRAWPTSTHGRKQPPTQPLFNRSAGLPMPSALIKYNRSHVSIRRRPI